MTRQHFSLVAEGIANAVGYLEKASWLDESERKLSRQVVWTVAEFVAQQLAKTNPNFSYVRFYKSCGLN
jgi:type IV secretory pathway TrbD component